MNELIAERELASATAQDIFPRSSFNVAVFQDGEVVEERIEVICEHELALFVNGRPLATLMCSDAHLCELACGFLFSEGLIDRADEIVSLELDPGHGRFDLRLAYPVTRPTSRVVTSGFGGAALFAPSDVREASSPAGAGVCSLPETSPALAEEEAAGIQRAVTAMRVGAREYAATRGTHCSALFADGEMIALFEDIGRHNTFDKLAGHCLLSGVDAAGTLLATTGRVSSEMLRKAARLGVTTVASLSGPTDAAVRAARAAGMRLAGYVNSSRLTIYAG